MKDNLGYAAIAICIVTDILDPPSCVMIPLGITAITLGAVALHDALTPGKDAA